MTCADQAFPSRAGSADSATLKAMRFGPIAALLAALGAGCGGVVRWEPGPDAGTEVSVDSGPVPPDVPAPPPDLGPPPDVSPPTDAPTSCAKCVAAKCGTESKACAADPMCVKRVDCMNACTDADCQAKCIADFPTKAGDDYIACIKDLCRLQCVT